jgi:hypothetical protein
MTSPIPFRAFARDAAHVLSPARSRRFECYELKIREVRSCHQQGQR